MRRSLFSAAFKFRMLQRMRRLVGLPDGEILQLMQRYSFSPRGIVHVGANIGQEFEVYRASGAERVVWIEPVAHLFEELKRKIRRQTCHFAINALCADRTGEDVVLNVSSNMGLSSSIFPLGRHAEIYPTVSYVGQMRFCTITLDLALEQGGFRFEDFDCLVVDVQGAELKVLQGASQVLKGIRYIYIEVSDRPLYEGGATLSQIRHHLGDLGFRLRFLAFNAHATGNAFFLR